MANGEVEGTNEGVVDQGLEDNRHEACLTHVVETTKAFGTAWCRCGIGGENLAVDVGHEDGVLALLALLSAYLFKSVVIDKVVAFSAVNIALARFDT